MINFAVIDDTGRIVRSGVCPDEVMHLQGDLVVACAPGVTAETHYWNGEEIVPLPADLVGMPYAIVEGAPVADLAAVRARQRAMINQARDMAQDGGCDTPSGRFDTKPRSREFLNGAVLAATLAGMNSEAFTINWKLANNSVVTLNGPQIIAAGLAVAAWVDTVHQRAVVLKARIDAAATVAAILAVGWTLTDPE